MKKVLIALIFVFSCAILAFPASAHYTSNVLDVNITTDDGNTLSMYNAYPAKYVPNTQRYYIEAQKGKRYAINITNNTNRRVGLVIAVDGRNIISGQKSYLKNTERMYILNPYSSGSFEGWRTSQNQINRFYFTSDDKSYAGAWGDYSAMGVIAVTAFYEKKPPEPLYEDKSFNVVPCASMKGKSASDSAARESQPGTGFGEDKYSPSYSVEFEPENSYAERYFIKYEWRQTLCNKKVINCSIQKNRFWDDNNGYAPYPPSKY